MPYLAADDLSKSYPSPDGSTVVPVLAGVSLTLDRGRALAIVGPSGSGKSTLLNLLGGLDRPSSGRVLLDGQDLADLDDDALARVRNTAIGFVFQEHHLLPQCTALDNATVPALVRGKGELASARSRATVLMERVGLQDRLTHLPSQLSGGERQRLAVVRALVNQPGLVLADEPTGSLDSKAADELGDLLLELNDAEPVALIVVTHSERLARRFDGILRLDGGRLVRESGGGGGE